MKQQRKNNKTENMKTFKTIIINSKDISPLYTVKE